MLRRKFLPPHWVSKVRIFRRAYATMRFDVKFYRSVQGFNSDDYDFRALILKGTCTKKSRLSSTRSARLRYKSDTSVVRSSGDSGRLVIQGPQCNPYYFLVLCTSGEFL